METSTAAVLCGKNVFITGFTGLVGKCMVWKLLTEVSTIGKIFVLIRGNKSSPDATERFKEVISSPPLNTVSPSLLEKVVPIEGDLFSDFDPFLAQLGEVDVVIHAAASVNFEESLKVAVKTNLEGCANLLDFCASRLKPKLFIHVSTAYAHCDRGVDISEEIYKQHEDPTDVINSFRWLSSEMSQSLQPHLLRTKPNCYVYSKALAENYVNSKAPSLSFPVAIVRPTIIGAALEEPFPGFIDNFNALTGAISGFSHGVWRVTGFDGSRRFDCIPVDFCVNGIISTATYCLTNAQPGQQKPFVVHLSTGSANPVRWQIWNEVQILGPQVAPMENSIRYPRVFQVPAIVEKPVTWLYQDLFALMYDFLLALLGHKFRLRRLNRRLYRLLDLTKFFILNEWNWEQTNFLRIKGAQCEKDKVAFNLDYSRIQWHDYFLVYYLGVKKFLMKEDTSDLTKAKRRAKVLKCFYYVIEPLIIILLCVFIFYFCRAIAIKFSKLFP